MNKYLNRAQLLYHQSRYDQAEQEVRRVLGEMPQDAGAHALLALCLVEQEKYDDAQAEAEQAIVAEPDSAYVHYCRSVVMEKRKRFKEAEASAREAIGLEPMDADYHARLAATLFQQEKWQATLDAALEGLSYDAENEACNHLRTMALTKLGRQNEAVASVDALLQRAPDDAYAHTNKGWALLHQRKPREALEHFREALRIDATNEYAQAGIVEALKARNPVYRWMLAYFLWMARLPGRARWGVIIGGYIGYRFLFSVARESPEWAPWVTPLIVLYLVFAILTWFAVPLFNLLLRFNKFGWYALSRDKRVASNWFGGCVALFVGAVVAYFVWDTFLALMFAGFAVGMALPLVTIYHCDVGWPRTAMTWFAAAMAVVGLATIACTVANLEVSLTLFYLFLFGFVATPWVANYLASVTPTR
jgi:tetratricopeptide (TPR) repeat protein